MEPCGHLVCHACLKQLLQSRHRFCPFCREPIKDSEPVCVNPFHSNKKPKSDEPSRDVPLGTYEFASAVVEDTVSQEIKDKPCTAFESVHQSPPVLRERKPLKPRRPQSMATPSPVSSTTHSPVPAAIAEDPPMYAEIRFNEKHSHPQQSSNDNSRLCFPHPASTKRPTSTISYDAYETLFNEQYSSADDTSSSPPLPPPLQFTGSSTDFSLSDHNGRSLEHTQLPYSPLVAMDSMYSEHSSCRSYDASRSESVSSGDDDPPSHSHSRPRDQDTAQHKHKGDFTSLHAMDKSQTECQSSSPFLAVGANASLQHAHKTHPPTTITVTADQGEVHSPSAKKSEPDLTASQLSTQRSDRSFRSYSPEPTDELSKICSNLSYEPPVTRRSRSSSQSSSPIPPYSLNSPTRQISKATVPSPDSTSHQNENHTTYLYHEWLSALRRKGISQKEAERALEINQMCLKLSVSLLRALDKKDQ